MLFLALGCLPLPAPDFRRPASLVYIEGGETPPGLEVRVCTWSTRRSVLDGCGNIEEGHPAEDGWGVREWSVFPLVLDLESPMWGDAFVVCEGTRPRGVRMRLPNIPVKWKEKVPISLDKVTRIGESRTVDVDDATAKTLAERMCRREQPLLEE